LIFANFQDQTVGVWAVGAHVMSAKGGKKWNLTRQIFLKKNSKNECHS